MGFSVSVADNHLRIKELTTSLETDIGHPQGGGSALEGFAGLGEFGGLFVEDAERSLHIVVDQSKFRGGITGGELHHAFGKPFVEAAEAVEGFGEGPDKDFTAVGRIAKALDEAGLFEAVQDSCDGAGGEAGGAGQLASSEVILRITGHEFEASGIGDIQAQLVGNRLVKKNGECAEFAAEVHGNPSNQFVALARRGGEAHFILTPKYLTN